MARSRHNEMHPIRLVTASLAMECDYSTLARNKTIRNTGHSNQALELPDGSSVLAWRPVSRDSCTDFPTKDSDYVCVREGELGQVWASMNLKGGVGKTTLTANLCRAICDEKPLKLLMIDTDPQCSLTLIFRNEEQV